MSSSIGTALSPMPGQKLESGVESGLSIPRMQAALWVSGDIRGMFQLVQEAASTFFQAPHSVGMINGFGIASGFGMVTGGLGMKGAQAGYESSKKIGDDEGRFYTVFSGLKEFGSFMTGGVALGLQATAVVAHAAALKIDMVAMVVFGHVATAFGALTYTVFTIPAIFKIINTLRAKSALNEQMQVDGSENQQLKRALEHMYRQIDLNEDDRFAAYATHKETGADPEGLSEADKTFISARLKEDGLGKALMNRREVKRAEFARRVGGETLEMLTHYAPTILKKLDEGDDEAIEKAREIVKSANREMNTTLKLYSVLFVSCLFAIAAFTLSGVATGGMVPALVVIFSIISSVTMIGIDVYGVSQGFFHSPAGKQDKWVALATFAVMAAIITVSAILSGGAGPLVLSLITGAVLLAYHGWVWYKSTYDTSYTHRPGHDVVGIDVDV